MKAIVSHDIDHLTLTEHYLNDTIVPKFFIRTFIELTSGKISVTEFMHRFGDVFKNQWQHIEELHAFNIKNGVPTTYFIGVKRGLGLSYSQQQSEYWIKKMLQLGCRVGVHGIEFASIEKISEEYNLFKRLSLQQSFGTRMHYIRKNESTFTNMAKAGYVFDSSEMDYKAPYKINTMWEFPFQLMDSYVIEKPKQWQSRNFQQSCEESKRVIDKVVQLNLPYLGIDFHDRYFSASHKTWKEWYMWLIEYLRAQKIEFIDFNSAIKELEP